MGLSTEETGFLSERYDHKQLAADLCFVLDNDEMRHGMERAAR